MIERIKLEDREIILVGTAHISHKSIELVEQTIDSEIKKGYNNWFREKNGKK